MFPTRREFVASLAGPLAAAPCLAELEAAVRRLGSVSAARAADDEEFWFAVQNSFPIDRSLVNFNNGGTCPAPSVVQEALKRHIDFSNHAPTRQMWGVLGPQIETVRERLARDLGVSPDEIAITRNATESLEICQFGLDLARGDEVLLTTHEYPSMVATWKQRAEREGIVVKQVRFDPPATQEALFDLYRRNVTERTRVLHVSHITNLTGQIFPVARICDLARERGLEVIVDGAHAYGQFPFQLPDLRCDFYGVSLHKWILAPIGTGLLYVKRNRIADLWPLFGNAAPRGSDIRKFESIGTHPFAPKLAIAEALTHHQTIGAERKARRLAFLRELATAGLRRDPRFVVYTPEDPRESAAIVTVGIRGPDGTLLDPARIVEALFAAHRIVTTPISVDDVRGIRITPNVYTTREECDLLREALLHLAEKGLPKNT